MTLEEFVNAWINFVEGKNGAPISKYDVNDFCNIYATSYEEYTAMWELLAEWAECED